MTKNISRTLLRMSSGIAGLVVLLIAIIATNAILNNVRLRVDLTEENLYSLSDGTRTVLKDLEQNLTLKLFFSSSSPDMPIYLKNYAKQVEDLLQEYRLASGKRLTIEKYDPCPDSDAEEWARNYGLQGSQMGMFGPPLYLGLVAVAGGNEGILPYLDPRNEKLLEYELTRLIHRTVHPEKPVVGVMSSLPVMGMQMQANRFMMPQQQQQMPPAWIAFRDLKEDYDVRDIPMSADSIAADVDALILVHPKSLTDETLYAIDQFVLRGGQLLAFLDPVSVAEAESLPPAKFQRPDTSSDLGPLLAAWGVGYDVNQTLADPSAMSRLQGQNNQLDDSLVWLSFHRKHISDDDVITSQLEYLMMPLVGSFTDRTDKDLTFTPLITASKDAGMVNKMMAQFGGSAVRRDLKPSPTTLYAAIRLSGHLVTAFPSGAPSQEKASDGSDSILFQPEPPLAEGTSSIILVADVDFLSDRYCVAPMDFFGTRAYRPLNDNLGFLANAVEQIAGGANLASIRSRGTFNRPFSRVLKLQQKASAEWQAKGDRLEKKLRETQQQLASLQAKKDSSQRLILNNEQKDAIERFRSDEKTLNKDLKAVRKNLRADIDSLGTKVKAINILLMPTLVGLIGITFGIYRSNRK